MNSGEIPSNVPTQGSKVEVALLDLLKEQWQNNTVKYINSHLLPRRTQEDPQGDSATNRFPQARRILHPPSVSIPAVH